MKLFALFIFLAPTWAFGFEAAYERVQTSDSIQSFGLRAKQDLKDFSVLGGTQQLQFPSGIKRIHWVGISKGFALSETQSLVASARLADIDHDDRHRLRGLGSLTFVKAEKKWNLSLSAQQNLPAQTVSILRPEFVDVREGELSGSFSYLFIEKLRFQTSHSLGFRNDGPRKRGSDTSLMYGLSAGWPWIWVGYGYYTLNFSERSLAYWSPKDFKTHGLRIDSSFPIYKELSGIFGLNMNNYDEDGFTGTGHYGVAGVQWGQSQGNHAKITWTEIRSGQSSSPWRYDGLMLSFQLLDK